MNVLIIEDVNVIGYVAKKSLERLGYKCWLVFNINEAINLIHNHCTNFFHIILIDINLNNGENPLLNMEGFQFYLELQNNIKTTECSLFLWTSDKEGFLNDLYESNYWKLDRDFIANLPFLSKPILVKSTEFLSVFPPLALK